MYCQKNLEFNLNNITISIQEDGDQGLESKSSLKEQQHNLFDSNLLNCFKSNAIMSSLVQPDCDSFRISDNVLECDICLENYDFEPNLKLDDYNLKNQIYRIESCKCKFCINVSFKNLLQFSKNLPA
jgi:hypothetical protein